MAATATSPSASASGATPLPFVWARLRPFFDARPVAGTGSCAVAPLPMSRAIVVQRLVGPRDSGRRGDRPAAQDPDGLGLGAQVLDRRGQRFVAGRALDV